MQEYDLIQRLARLPTAQESDVDNLRDLTWTTIEAMQEGHVFSNGYMINLLHLLDDHYLSSKSTIH